MIELESISRSKISWLKLVTLAVRRDKYHGLTNSASSEQNTEEADHLKSQLYGFNPTNNPNADNADN